MKKDESLTETIAMKLFSRFGVWPEWFVPNQKQLRRAEQLRRSELFDQRCIAALDRESERIGMQCWPPGEWLE